MMSPPHDVHTFVTAFGASVVGVAISFASPSAVWAQPVLPPLQQPATSEHHPGKVIFEQLVTPNLASAKQFYGSLFGWTFQEVPAGATPYAEALLDGRPVASMIQKPLPPGSSPAWLTVIAATDVDVVSNTAVKDGAKLLSSPHDIPNLGREAALADPQGGVFAILASSTGDPPETLPKPGGWIWNSLITRDPDTSAQFFQTLFDYAVYDLPAPEDAHHLIVATGGYARASINPMPLNHQGAPAHWLSFVRVTDPAATISKAVSLGGRVLLQPQLDRQGGMVAVVADPQGAPVGLMEWPGDADVGSAK